MEIKHIKHGQTAAFHKHKSDKEILSSQPPQDMDQVEVLKDSGLGGGAPQSCHSNRNAGRATAPLLH